jgi:hypothetical protein
MSACKRSRIKRGRLGFFIRPDRTAVRNRDRSETDICDLVQATGLTQRIQKLCTFQSPRTI